MDNPILINHEHKYIFSLDVVPSEGNDSREYGVDVYIRKDLSIDCVFWLSDSKGVERGGIITYDSAEKMIAGGEIFAKIIKMLRANNAWGV